MLRKWILNSYFPSKRKISFPSNYSLILSSFPHMKDHTRTSTFDEEIKVDEKFLIWRYPINLNKPNYVMQTLNKNCSKQCQWLKYSSLRQHWCVNSKVSAAITGKKLIWKCQPRRFSHLLWNNMFNIFTGKKDKKANEISTRYQ